MAQLNQSQPFLKAVAVPHAGNAFDVDVSSRAFPGDQPLMVEARPVSGATVVVDDAFKAGSKIPFDGMGVSPLVGT